MWSLIMGLFFQPALSHAMLFLSLDLHHLSVKMATLHPTCTMVEDFFFLYYHLKH